MRGPSLHESARQVESGQREHLDSARIHVK